MEPQHPPISPPFPPFPSAPLHRDVGEERDETLAVMLEQERTGYACGDYLGRRRGRQDRGETHHQHRVCQDQAHHGITPEDRTKIVDWCYAIADLCRFDRESVARAMSAVDRYMSISSDKQDALLQDRGQYQLLAVTALYVSVKVHERSVINSDDFSAASRGTYTAQEIESTELELLHGLGWRMCPPTALQVGYRVLDLVEARAGQPTARTEGDGDGGAGAFDFLRDEMAYQTECAVRGYALSVRRPSTVAVASVLNAMEQVARDAAEYGRLTGALMRVLRDYDFDSPIVIAEARDELRGLVQGGNDSQERTATMEAEEVFEEDSTVGSRRLSLDDVNIVEELEGIQEYYLKAYGGALIVPDASEDVEDDDSFKTVHY